MLFLFTASFIYTLPQRNTEIPRFCSPCPSALIALLTAEGPVCATLKPFNGLLRQILTLRLSRNLFYLSLYYET
uniref:Uncharacterized protein n=1 Tax=Vibrio sp. FF_307 TaxID=1652834 RepID=A0A0H4A433_9VIBR|nr:hypothetical protein [Vibrio sp. FF_307]